MDAVTVKGRAVATGQPIERTDNAAMESALELSACSGFDDQQDMPRGLTDDHEKGPFRAIEAFSFFQTV